MFSIELKTTRPIDVFELKECAIREYDSELDDGRSVIMDICEVFADTKAIAFSVSGFGEENWAVDCRFDLPIIMEQIPEIIGKINLHNFNFNLDFYEQGIERELQFQDNVDSVIIICTSRTSWTPMPNKIEMEKEDVYKIFNDLYQNFQSYSAIVCRDLANHNLLRTWMENK